MKIHKWAMFILLAAWGMEARAILSGFETIDGYNFPFSRDVWSYDAGQTGSLFTPPQYNTGRWQEILGSSKTGDSQYISQHGIGSGGAVSAPFALAVRSESPSSNGTYDMTVRYVLGADDLGVTPTMSLLSARVSFDICFGRTLNTGAGPTFDPVFNNIPAFSLSIGGTDIAPGATIGFTDPDSSNGYLPRFFYFNGTVYQSQPVPWSNGRFDHVDVNFDFTSGKFDVSFTSDFNNSTNGFEPGNTPITIVNGATMTSSISMLDALFFRAHTDPSDGSSQYALSKSFLDNFRFSVATVPEPDIGSLVGAALIGWFLIRRRRERSLRPPSA
jgi:hypothetical protein